jgi:hypothetical protein
MRSSPASTGVVAGESSGPSGLIGPPGPPRLPHSSLGWRPPAAYAASLTTNKSRNAASLTTNKSEKRPDSYSRTDKLGPVKRRKRRDRSMQPPGMLPWSM